MNEENMKIDRATICHPSPSGKGSALRLELHPAHGSATGYIMIELARQIVFTINEEEVRA